MKKFDYAVLPVLMILLAMFLLVQAEGMADVMALALMCLVMMAGVLIGLVPLQKCRKALQEGMEKLNTIARQNPSSAWKELRRSPDIFGESELDHSFALYLQQEADGASLDDCLNEDLLDEKAHHAWMPQIPWLVTVIGLAVPVLARQVSVQSCISALLLSVLFNVMYWSERTSAVRSLRQVKEIITRMQRQAQAKAKSISIQDGDDVLKVLNDNQEDLKLLDELSHSSSSRMFSLAFMDLDDIDTYASILMPQIQAGMDRDEFTFCLQPVYDLNTMQITGADALARWQHQKLGMIAPSVFIPTLEKNGKIVQLDQYIWDQVCRKIRQWMDAGLNPVPISVNISKTDILDLDLPRVFKELIAQYDIPARYLELDFAQNAYIEANVLTCDAEKSLKAMGFQVYGDGFDGDFGGMVSLKVPAYPNGWKLDLRRCQDEEQIRSAREIAETYNAPITALGVENEEQLDMLRRAGIGKGQGYYMNKPVLSEEFEQIMGWKNQLQSFNGKTGARPASLDDPVQPRLQPEVSQGDFIEMLRQEEEQSESAQSGSVLYTPASAPAAPAKGGVIHGLFSRRA